jgi:hypothetical protein
VKTEDIKETILKNSSEVLRLHAALHETHRHRDESPQARDAWTQAAHEFRNRFNDLAFPGGYEGALDRLLSGDALAMEAAICFLELRPYFFHSGFMFKDLLRKSRKAPLSTEQQLRLDAIEVAVFEWRKEKLSLLGKTSSKTHSSRTTAHG